jgi:hypothetical protein
VANLSAESKEIDLEQLVAPQFSLTDLVSNRPLEAGQPLTLDAYGFSWLKLE